MSERNFFAELNRRNVYKVRNDPEFQQLLARKEQIGPNK